MSKTVIIYKGKRYIEKKEKNCKKCHLFSECDKSDWMFGDCPSQNVDIVFVLSKNQKNVGKDGFEIKGE